ncbi:hypothetical protein VCHC17A1_3950, partial [Vibrio cholerae HC-17A1]
MLLINSHN